MWQRCKILPLLYPAFVHPFINWSTWYAILSLIFRHIYFRILNFQIVDMFYIYPSIPFLKKFSFFLSKSRNCSWCKVFLQVTCVETTPLLPNGILTQSLIILLNRRTQSWLTKDMKKPPLLLLSPHQLNFLKSSCSVAGPVMMSRFRT